MFQDLSGLGSDLIALVHGLSQGNQILFGNDQPIIIAPLDNQTRPD
ncbi:hypothetical protein [Desulfobacter curvatus]|nr:hypothetical protein [Desulfobacter curvatus]